MKDWFLKFWAAIKPSDATMKRLFKALLTVGAQVFEAALVAVMSAEATGKSGKEKFILACMAVQQQFPTIAAGVIQTYVQNAWFTKETEGWK